MKIYIHVGYPKNASTTLQTDVFPNIEDALYLGRIYNSVQPFISKELSDAMYQLSHLDSIDLSFDEVKSKIYTAIGNVEGQTDKIIISSEAFANNFVDRGVMAERLYELFPDAKILIIIRRQMEALLSMYAFLVCQNGGNVNISYGRPSVKSIEQWIFEQESYIGRSYITSLKYSGFISKYWKLYGKENVTVLLFEELVNSPESFFEKIYSYFEMKDIKQKIHSSIPNRNAKPTNRKLMYYKLRNRMPNISLSKYFPSLMITWWRSYLSQGSSKRGIEELPSEMRERLLLIYREDNRKLQKQLDINIEKYGYVL